MGNPLTVPPFRIFLSVKRNVIHANDLHRMPLNAGKVPDRRGGSLIGRHHKGHELCTRPDPRTKAECWDDTAGWLYDESDKRVYANGTHWVDVLQGGYAVWWVERYMRLYEGRWAGEPAIQHGCKTCKRSWTIPKRFDPEHAKERAAAYVECVNAGHDVAWQYAFWMRLFGWMTWDEEKGRILRRFRRGDLWIPKKNMKALALDTMLPTPAGWTTIGEVQVGDELFDKDGKRCRVTQLHEIIVDDAHELHFSNGQRIVANGEHLWLTQSLGKPVAVESSRGANQHTGNKSTLVGSYYEAVRTTDEIRETLKFGSANNHRIPMHGGIDCEEAELPIEPYMLGLWLGDGDSDCGRITADTDDAKFYATQVDLRPNKGFRYRIDGLYRKLRLAGLLKNKHIPREYLRASKQQRMALIQGLMDSDGCIGKNGRHIYFSQSRKRQRLIDGFCELLASVGIKYSQKGDEYATVQFCTDLPVFRLPRKLSRIRSKVTRSKNVHIVDVVPVGQRVVRCISVSSESGTFLCGETMLTTHNSPTLAFLGWYLSVADGVKGQKVYFGAKDGAQAKELVGGHAVAAWEESPDLQSCVRYKINEMVFTHVPTKSQMKPLSSSNARTTKSKEGINGSVLIDERHVVDAEFMKRIKRAGISRLEPIELGVSTAGLSTIGHGKSRQDYGRSVANGEVVDDGFLFICYEAPQTTDIEQLTKDEVLELGKAANPAWGITITESEFLADWNESRNASLDELWDFGTYRLNVWQNSSSPWLRPASWAKCGRDFTFDELKGRPCVLGLDLSRTRDMTAAVLVFEKENERRQIWPLFWIPENTARKHQAKVADFMQWEKEGHLLTTPKDTISQAQVLEQLGALLEQVECSHVFYDATFADWLTEQLVERYEIERVVFPQSMSQFAGPTAALEEEILSGVIEHPNHPVLDWQLRHCHVYRNRFTKQQRPVKPSDDSKDPRTIDGIVALAMGMQIDLVEAEPVLDYYETHGLELM